VRLLLDTHFLLWSVASSRKLPSDARALLIDPRNTILFSAASIWEVAIKSTLGRPDFRVDVARLLEAAADTGFIELPVTSAHAARVTTLPDLHKDPFDRLLIAQALAESALLLTNDAPLGQYSKQVRVF
jgi:PIN domain nuclease of toxin-antitoxin system